MIFGAIMMQNDRKWQSDQPGDSVLEQSARAIAPAQTPEHQPQGRGNQSDVVDDQGSLDFSISSTSQMPMTTPGDISVTHEWQFFIRAIASSGGQRRNVVLQYERNSKCA